MNRLLITSMVILIFASGAGTLLKARFYDRIYWDDLLVPGTSVKLAGNADPAFTTAFKTNGAGSTGVIVYQFLPDTLKEVFFTAQMPHSWNGTAIYPHVHWSPVTASDEGPANQTVEWGLEYTWVNVNGTFGDTGIVYAKSSAGLTTPGQHKITGFSAIAPSADQGGISSILVCRLFRNAADAADDTYEGNAAWLQFDIHYQQDSPGSRQETIK